MKVCKEVDMQSGLQETQTHVAMQESRVTGVSWLQDHWETAKEVFTHS